MNGWRRLLVWTVCAAIVSGSSLQAAEQGGRQAVAPVRDIAVRQGVLQGVVVDRQAVPVAGHRVRLYAGTTQVAEVVTDVAGRFQVHGVRPGLHAAGLGTSRVPIRFWDLSKAPGNAPRQLVFVMDQSVVRGQSGTEGCGEDCGESCGEGCDAGGTAGGVAAKRSLTMAALLLAAGGTAAVIAISQNDDDAPASP